MQLIARTRADVIPRWTGIRNGSQPVTVCVVISWFGCTATGCDIWARLRGQMDPEKALERKMKMASRSLNERREEHTEGWRVSGGESFAGTMSVTGSG